MGIAPDDAAMVGDTPIDVAAARAVGVRAWAVRSDYSTREKMERAKADLYFEQITNMLDFL